ncbi:Vp-like protein, partial [Thalictrum thalictroides]
MPNVNNDLRSVLNENDGLADVPPIHLGKSGTSNEGITWFGSSYVGPGNLLCDSEGHFIGKALPTSAIDKVAFQHDADYFNTTDVSKDHIWELDKKAIQGALAVSDSHFGAMATVVGLVAKRGLDLADEFLTGNQTAIYPNKPNISGVHFDTTPYLKAAAAAADSSGVEEDPDLDWSYDGHGNPNSSASSSASSSQSSSHVESGSASGSSSMASSSGSKRPADSSGGDGGPSAKKAGTGVALPGTGNATDGDPDTGNPSPENAVIPRPISNSGGFTMVFRKVHTFISYGCAWKVLKYNNHAGAYLGTTSLMNVPVDQPWFYLSPSEFKLLPRGALCTKVRVNGVMRNPRTAFETNSSTSSLATLNQNKFMVKADGLNLKTR